MHDCSETTHDQLRAFLISLDTDKTRHGSRTLFQHLKGVHDLLRDWNNENYVCLAGLFHSIYGTNTFKHQSMSDRDELSKMIGVKAELLVHYFSTKDRPFFESIEDNTVRRDLQEIEVANLLEQGGGNSHTLRKFGRIKALTNGAKAALNCGVV